MPTLHVMWLVVKNRYHRASLFAVCSFETACKFE